MGGVVQSLLMPAEGKYTKDFAGFDPPDPNCLLIIRGVRLSTSDALKTRRFLVEALGADGGAGAVARGASVSANTSAQVGVTTFECVPGGSKPWPGQFYLWVQDIQATWAGCKTLQAREREEVILEELCLKEETKVDALLVRDPSSGALFMVNQAPKGYARIVEEAGVPHSNILALMDIRRLVPPGVAEKLATFYKTQVGASVRLVDGAYRVSFAMGPAVRQTLTFQDDPDLTECGADEAIDALTITMPSHTAYTKCQEQLSSSGLVAPDIAVPKGLQVPRCLGEAPGGDALGLAHTFLSPAAQGAFPPTAPAQSPVAAGDGGPADDALLGA